MTTLEQIAKLCMLYNDGKVIFEEPLKIKATPHQEVFTAFGVWSGPAGIWLMNDAGEWHGPLLESQAFGPLMISSIYQRLKSIEINVGVAIAKHDPEVNATIVE